MYSESAVKDDTACCSLLVQEMKPPIQLNTQPVVEHRVVWQPAW